jgi:hypothetical protein
MFNVNVKDIEIQNIDHLGIVAGIVDSIGLVEIINNLGSELGEKVQCWACCKSNDFSGDRLQPNLQLFFSTRVIKEDYGFFYFLVFIPVVNKRNFQPCFLYVIYRE